MAIYTYENNARPIIDAAQLWVKKCLIEDGSIFANKQLWTSKHLDELNRYFVQRPDAGDGSFYEKLQTQLNEASAGAKQLMAEILWALFLFPSNISATTKRDSLMKVWGWSGESLDPKHPMLAEAVLDGIGSGGMGINNHRWRELVYMIGMASQLKALNQATRQQAFSDYDHFLAWVERVPQDGERQFRQMLRYFLFPERVERMSSNNDRKKILLAMGIASRKELNKWTDRQIDDALLGKRRELEAQFGTAELDFYTPPLREMWMAEGESIDSSISEVTRQDGIAESNGDYYVAPAKPRNMILYGPPGTGKTWRLQQMFTAYTDQPADVDRNTWELNLVAKHGWRAVIVAALAELGQSSKVSDIAIHPLVLAKAKQRERQNSFRSTLWGYLQEHTPPHVTTVSTAIRRQPYVFSKNETSDWSLLSDWRTADPEADELAKVWKSGPGSSQSPVKRYRIVTFHPSYSYEDFVVGLRPVMVDDGEDSPRSGFRMVDGAFKQICAQAKADPGKRYALFIDEINRANIAKVFGELITLLEVDKRARYDKGGTLIGGLEVQLPGTEISDDGDHQFGVPANLDVYGTMNTADRSIALLDIALRRRFEFEEMGPKYEILAHKVDGIDLGKLLRSINDRLEFLADRDRLIGHAYFTHVKSLDDLRSCFKFQVIPLLQEYFFDDWSRVQQVLSVRGGSSPFVLRESLDGTKLFNSADDGLRMERFRFAVTATDTWTTDAFQSLYESASVHDVHISP